MGIQEFKLEIITGLSSFILSTFAAAYLKSITGDVVSIFEIVWRNELNRQEVIVPAVVCVILFHFVSDLLAKKNQATFWPVFEELGLYYFPLHPPSGILEKLDNPSKGELAWAARQVTWSAVKFFGLAGSTSCIVFLLFYTVIFDYPSLSGINTILFCIGGYIWGRMSGEMVIRYAHPIFSGDEFAELSRFIEDQ